jgi:cell division FtsZ-interacting protein ZapD
MRQETVHEPQYENETQFLCCSQLPVGLFCWKHEEKDQVQCAVQLCVSKIRPFFSELIVLNFISELGIALILHSC